MKLQNDQINLFLDEASELIESMEKTLLILDENPKNKTAIHDFFRGMHTLKGSSSMFGYPHLSDFAHHFESIYDLIRNDELDLNKTILTASFSSIDHFRILLSDAALQDIHHQKEHEARVKELNSILKVSSVIEKKETSLFDEDDEPTESTWHLNLILKQDFYSKEIDVLPVLESLQSLGTCSFVINDSEVPEFNEFYDAFDCKISWDIILVIDATETTIREQFIFVDEEIELEIIKLSSRNVLDNSYLVNFIEAKKEASKGLQPFEFIQLHEETKNKKAEDIHALETEPDSEEDDHSASKNVETMSSIRVHVQKLDTLLSLVSELVTAQARLNVFIDTSSNNDLQEVAEDIEKITRRLRENAFSISMVPLSTMETRFQRLVRDISSNQHKKVQLISSGLDTELEKSLIERLTPPLLHVFRNAVDHGIETPEIRKAKGKPEVGTILINALYSGAHVMVEISDDGNGIDLEKVKQKAISKGFFKADAAVSENEILDILFKPGFSTSETITDVSGRGVGMDVVRTALNQMRGDATIESKAGEGTKISLRLPLTLSILDGLLVSSANQKFIIPLQFLDKCYEIPNFTRNNAKDDILIIEGEQIPYIDLRDLLEDSTNRPIIPSLVMIRFQQTKVGILIDHIIGEHQAVVKSLGTLFRKVQSISGATILGDGEIALILDVNKIITEYVTLTNLKKEVLI